MRADCTTWEDAGASLFVGNPPCGNPGNKRVRAGGGPQHSMRATGKPVTIIGSPSIERPRAQRPDNKWTQARPTGGCGKARDDARAPVRHTTCGRRWRHARARQ